MPERPYVWLDPGRLSGEPCIGGHRLSVYQFAELWWYGEWTFDNIYDNWELTRGDLLLAFWFCGTYGKRPWRSRWGAWAKAQHSPLCWRSNYEAVPLPPQREG